MPAAVFLEWLNANSFRSYPIKENSSKKSVSGDFTIPDGIFLSAQINAPRDYIDGSFFIKRVGSFKDTFYFVLSFVDSSFEEHQISKVTIDKNSHSLYQYYSFTGSGEHYAVVGNFCIGEVKDLLKDVIGEFEFEPQSTTIEPSCLFVSIPAVKSVEVYSGDDLIHVANDVLRLKAGQNIRLTYLDDEKKTIRIDAVYGENVIEKDECENSPYEKAGCIKTINGIPPDENGNFNVYGSDCIRIDPEDNGISVHDLCSQSCCGCDELQELVEGLEAVREQEENLKALIELVNRSQTEMIERLTSRIV